MSPELEQLAREAGFCIFDGRAVAADGGISGEATASLERFALLVEQRAMGRAAQVCRDMACGGANFNIAAEQCADAIASRKST
jgi:hypothetical protein